MTSTIRTEDFTGNLFFILEETFESPPRPGNAYLDEQTGWFHTLQGITAAEASTPVTPGGTTIAGHVAHTTFYLEVLEASLHKRGSKVDWRESWGVQDVDEEGWEMLKGGLETTCKRVKALLSSVETWQDDEIGDALAILTHSAYHLGAVRQMVLVARGGAVT